MNTEEETLQDQQPGRRMRLGDQAERLRFEQYRGGDFERDAQGYYTNPRTAQDWAMWQAALSALPSPDGQEALSAQALWMLPDDARLVGVIADNIERGKLDHPGFYRNTQLAEALRRVLVTALSAKPSTPSSFNVEAMLAACVPGGDIADPQVIADNIRNWFANQTSQAMGLGHDCAIRYVLGYLVAKYGTDAEHAMVDRLMEVSRG